MHSALAGVAGGDLFLLKLIPLEKGSQCIRKCQNWCKSWQGLGGGENGRVVVTEPESFCRSVAFFVTNCFRIYTF